MRNEDWFDTFWCEINPNEDEGVSAVRILAEMFMDNLYWRDGDVLVGIEGNRFNLTKDDQYLMRTIIKAALETESVHD